MKQRVQKTSLVSPAGEYYADCLTHHRLFVARALLLAAPSLNSAHPAADNDGAAFYLASLVRRLQPRDPVGRFCRTNNRKYFEVGEIAPVRHPLVEQPPIRCLHQLKTPLEILIDQARNIHQARRSEPATLPKTRIDRPRVLESFDHHVKLVGHFPNARIRNGGPGCGARRPRDKKTGFENPLHRQPRAVFDVHGRVVIQEPAAAFAIHQLVAPLELLHVLRTNHDLASGAAAA
jgi:hypothetical protein